LGAERAGTVGSWKWGCRSRCTPSREIEERKNVLRSLIERGLRRVLLVVHDDFSGLLPMTRSLFPQADVQLCIVHLQRNAKSHRSKTDATEFHPRLRALKTAWSPEVAAAQLEDLGQRVESRSPVFIREIPKKRDHYRFPQLSRPYPPLPVHHPMGSKAVNGQLEIMRRNTGSYFQSRDISSSSSAGGRRDATRKIDTTLRTQCLE